MNAYYIEYKRSLLFDNYFGFFFNEVMKVDLNNQAFMQP